MLSSTLERDAPPLIMGILNVTPDSFSDGGRFTRAGMAVQHALDMIDEGADLIDIGGESTRPGALPVPAAEQERRVLPVIERLREVLPRAVRLSIDTTSSQVAEAALDAGAHWINDTSAGRDDPRMFALAAERAVPLVLMHRQGMPSSMQEAPSYQDVVTEVRSFLAERIAAACACGVEAAHILIDPGLGFGKTYEHNLALLARLETLVDLGPPLLLGASRKRFLSAICDEPLFTNLMPATCATTALGVLAGARVFRVHDVLGNRQAADVAWAVKQAARTSAATPL
ncbi:dihydropteroate synthase [Thiocapsa imhoffii]|uniref:Dihydropteroate synthase n=1 Tax=Thiocapsa imhoffii TaxID=382777 RepID=A0A9X1BA83_9GAMM|nr:dihydropteroate synthase [Thiocapsa imhoffii]MBK1645801.1 dihydropteroate synthase [Thiocapsa imhoffii]